MVHTAAKLDASLDALAKAEKRFAKALETHGRPPPRVSPPGVTTLLRTIVGQQVSVAAARSMWSKLEALVGSPPDLKVLLEAYLLDKAVYEVAYELNNRPDWVVIPLRGIRHILQMPR